MQKFYPILLRESMILMDVNQFISLPILQKKVLFALRIIAELEFIRNQKFRRTPRKGYIIDLQNPTFQKNLLNFVFLFHYHFISFLYRYRLFHHYFGLIRDPL